MKTNLLRLIFATLAGGLGMWIIAGLWHNLILPNINENVQAHHQGIGIMLIAYLILALLMSYIYTLIHKNKGTVIDGLKIGVIIGVLWVFPHGLVMAGAHDTSIVYEIKNALWHMFEQGVGGIIITFIFGNRKLKNV